MDAPTTNEGKLALIEENLQEVLNKEILVKVLEEERRPISIYWGTATTGRPHCGYFVPILKIAQFLQAGCEVTVLLADIHGFLDNLKAPIELVEYRAEYYKYVISELLKAVGVSLDRLEFKLGSKHQKTPEYMFDLLSLATKVSEHDAKKAGAEVVKQSDNAPLSGLIYPLMQALDEEYLKVDAQFGGVDQRKIFALAKDVLPKINYKERAHLMNPMVPGLQGGKMSASDPDSKIDVLDTADVVTKKIKKAQAPPKVVEGNGLLSFVEYVLLPAGRLKSATPRFEVPRRDAEPLVYTNIQDMRDDYTKDILTPQNLKPAITAALNALLEPIQAAFEADKQWQEIEKKAYPKVEAKVNPKKKKDKGSRYPGAPTAQVTAQPDGSVEGSAEAQATVEQGKDQTEALKKLELAEKAVQN